MTVINSSKTSIKSLPRKRRTTATSSSRGILNLRRTKGTTILKLSLKITEVKCNFTPMPVSPKAYQRNILSVNLATISSASKLIIIAIALKETAMIKSFISKTIKISVR